MSVTFDAVDPSTNRATGFAMRVTNLHWERISESLCLAPVFEDLSWDPEDIKGRVLIALAVGGAVPDYGASGARWRWRWRWPWRRSRGMKVIDLTPPGYLRARHEDMFDIVEWAIAHNAKLVLN